MTDIINNMYGTFISRRTIARYVQTNRIGKSPSKRRLDEIIPKEQIKTLVDTFKSSIEIKQLNCGMKFEVRTN